MFSTDRREKTVGSLREFLLLYLLDFEIRLEHQVDSLEREKQLGDEKLVGAQKQIIRHQNDMIEEQKRIIRELKET